MRKLKRIIAVALGVICALFLLMHLTYMQRGYTKLMGFYGEEKNTIDVCFVGTSSTFSIFMPMEAWNEYGMASFNYCTNMQFENALKYSLTDLERTQDPSVILIDIAPFIYGHYAGNTDFSEEDRQLFIKYNLDSRRYHADRLALSYEITRDNGGGFADFWYYVCDFTRYHTNTLTWSHFNNSEKDINKGYEYMLHDGGQAFTLSEVLAPDDSVVTPLEGIELTYLQELVEKIQGMDCQVVMYCGPIYFRETEQLGRKNFVEQYAQDAGITFWDLTDHIEEMDLDCETDYWNTYHFDALGAQKTTAYLAAKIEETFDLPDHRQDAEYAQWNEDYAEWEARLDSYIASDQAN